MEHCIICKHGTKIVWDSFVWNSSTTINDLNALKYLHCCNISIELRFSFRDSDTIFSLNKIDCTNQDLISISTIEPKRLVKFCNYKFTGNTENAQEVFDFLFKIYENLIFE